MRNWLIIIYFFFFYQLSYGGVDFIPEIVEEFTFYIFVSFFFYFLPIIYKQIERENKLRFIFLSFFIENVNKIYKIKNKINIIYYGTYRKSI